MSSPEHALYGLPPRDVIAPPAHALQVSPLIPGAAALEDLAPQSLSSVVVLAPPGTVERRFVLAQALRTLRVGGNLTALAPRNRGGLRLKTEFESFGLAVEEETRAHYRICRAARPAALEGIDAAILEGAPRFVENIGLWSQPGIFAWDRIDPGSRLLVETLPPLSGRGADLGAGTGYLSRAVLASPAVESLDLVDLDRRAVAAARRNVEDACTRFHWRDAAQPLPLADLNFVVTNPPFHRDGAEDRALGFAVARQAAQILRPGGQLWLVANQHLPYAAVLREVFAEVRVAAQDRDYRVLHAVR